MRVIFVLILALGFVLAMAPLPGHAAELAGVTLDETLRIGDATVNLAGMGIRTKTILKVKVYVAGLYLEKPSRDPSEIIRSDQAKAMVMIFLYKEVEGEKLQESWREGFEANTPSPAPDLKQRMEKFISLFSEPAVKGDRYTFSYDPGEGTRITLKGETRAIIPGSDFSAALMAVWFGDKLGDGGLKSLKKSILEGLE